MKSKKCSKKPANDKCLGTVSLADKARKFWYYLKLLLGKEVWKFEHG